MVALGVAFLSYTSYVNFVVNYMPGQRAEGFGWYENPNDLAIILVSVIPLLLLLANQASFWLGKLLFLAVAAMYAGNILFTASRNGLLGLSVAGFLCAFFSNTIPRVIRMALIVALGVAVIVVGGANVLQRKGVTGLRGDDSSEDRIIQWKAAGRMVMSRPLLGVGPGEFTTYAVEYGGIRGLVPHNTIIQVFAETGVIGGLFFVLFGFTSVLEAFRYIRSRKDVTDPGMCFLFVAFALVGFWVCAFFSNRYEFYILYVLVALMSAIKTNILSGDQSGA
jgi:O-antigen ligase